MPEHPPPHQSQPQTIQLGMTTDQVQAALGEAGKIFNVAQADLHLQRREDHVSERQSFVRAVSFVEYQCAAGKSGS